MALVPITVMGYRCERCGHEWIPRGGNLEEVPRVCPKCRSPYWNTPRKAKNTYEHFMAAVRHTLEKAQRPITWTELRTQAGLSQLFPNNQWVHNLEKDIGLSRSRDAHGVIHWQLKTETAGVRNEPAVKTADEAAPRARRKQGAVE
jgi:hypothetical protein